MNRVFTYLGKFAHMLLGYAAGSLAAGAFLNVVFLGFSKLIAPDMPPEAAAGTMIVTLPITALIVAYFAFLPALVAMLLAELLGKRDWLFYALAGGIVALVLVGLGYQSGEADFVRYGEPLVAAYMIGAGLVGGIAYWFVTGRFAGALRVTSPAP